MLFNKHSETKQRFGIRKLTIGACSVLLSTLFLTVNNGQQVNAATGDTVTNADNNKTETDSESVTKENEDQTKQTDNATTEVTNTSNGTDSTEKQKPEVEDKNGSAKVDDTKTTEPTEDKSSDSSSDQKLTEDKSANNDNENQISNKIRQLLMLKAQILEKKAATTDDSKPVLSQSTENGDMTLSISLPELSNKDYIPQTIKLNATNVNSGDKIVIKVKKSSAYGFAKENFPIGTVKESDQGDYRIFELDINTTGKFEYKITAKRTNNYQGQASPIQDTGVTTKDIQWSINGEDQAPLSFKQTIIPELISNGVSLAKATGDKNTDFTEVAPNEDYNFVYYMGENDGLVHDGSYMAGVVNSAVNYGTTITIPVPENFLLNQEVSDKANKERGLTDFTMTQDGMGKDVIITVPKGQSAQGWNSGGRYYTLTGKFVYDQIPEEPTTVTAKGDSVIDQIYTSDGQRITAKGKPFSVTISGKKGRPASGPLSLSVSGAISNNQLLLDSNPNNDPVAVNWFGYSNDYDNIENAKIKLDLADGLYVTGIKTPKDLGTVYNNIGNIQSYTYEMTLTNGQKITGTVKAGDIAKSTATTTDADNNQTIIGIRSIVFTPDTNTIGKDTKTDNLPNPGRIVDQEDRIDGKNPSNVFIALGHLSHTYDNGSQVKANDKLTSSITIFGSNFRPHRYNNNPIVSYTSSNIQTVFDTSQYKASLSTYGGQNSTNPGNQNAGGISLGDGDWRSNYDYIFEPIFYYVIPDNAVYSGGAISRLNSNGNESPVPVVTTYFVNGHQVVKLDYSNTNYYYNTKYGTNNGIPLDNVNNQTSNTRSWEIYAYSKDIPLLNNSYTSGKFLTPETAEKSGSTLKLDPSKFYYIGGGTWTINTASAVVLADAANGNKNPNGLYVQNGTSDDKGSDGMNFRVNVVNYDMTTDLKDLTAFINLPVKGYNNTTTNFFLSGPVDVPDGTVLYSTSSTDLPSGVGTKTPSTDNFLTKEQVEAKIASGEMSWADVKSIAVKYDTVKANSATKDIYIHGTDPDITKDAGKRVQLSWGLYGGNDMPPLVKKNASTIVISGSSTINTRLHYVDPEGKDQYVDVPTMSKTYKDNSDTMRDSDFNEKNIPASLIPKGYELVLQNGKAIKSIINNGGTTWATHAEDGSAQFGKVVLYNFDGDTVQFELTPKIDKATQTVKRTVHFVSDGDKPPKLPNDAYETATITELTNEVTGEKQYSATITAGGVTTDAPVVVGQDGQISISFPATTIPEVNKYYVVDSTKSEADAISPTFTFTKDGELPIENTVKYAPVKQELQVKVYDDDADDHNQALDTTKTGATVKFIGNSETAFPTDLQTNLEKLKQYYESENYIVRTLPVATGKFDNTPNGSGADKQIQVLEVHLTHGTVTVTGNDPKTPGKPINENDPDGVKYPSDVSKDNLVISSEVIIHYEGAGEKTPKNVIRTVDKTLTRTVTIDKVTGKVTNTSDWTGGKEYENVNTPVVNGYYVDKASASAGASTVTPADADPNSRRVHDGVITNETTVIYHPMGHIIPKDKSGNKIPGAETPIFTNDTKDPTKASTTNSPIIPGYHLETPSDSAITPDEPGKDRPVVYVADTQELKVQVFDLDGDTPDEPLKTDKTGATVDFTGDSFTNFPSDVATNVDSLIKYYTDRGYLVKTKPSDEELSGKFDGDKTQTQYLKLQLVHDKATVTGNDPKTPGEPINPKDPNGSKYPPEAGKDKLVISSQNIIHYYDEAGNKILDDKVTTDDSTLTRTVTIDKVTGDVISTGKWTGDKEYENVNTPVVNGYYVDKASASAGASTVTPADADPNSRRVHDGVITNETTVIYHPMGHIIPKDKSGNKIPGAETPIFTNDTKDPTKASTTNSPIIPGYHLETPSDSAITPDEPGKDRPVVYVADTQELKVQVFDLDGDTPDEPLKTDKTGATVDFTGDSFTNFPSDVATNVDSLIKYYTDRGYLVKTKPSDEELSGKFDGDKTQTQYLKLQLVHDKATVTGNDPKTPGEPINPKDPNGSKYPPEAGKDKLVISSQNIIHYYDEAGNKILDDKVTTDDSTLTRTVTIDKVTGDVISTGKWTGDKEYENVNTPVVNGYYVDKASASAGASTVTPADADPNSRRVHDGVITNETTVIYHPMGHIIPKDKSGNKIPGAETPIFTNDTKDPTKASTTNSPIIPGYHLETPSDSAITPDEPGKDRPVVYVADTQELKVQVFDLDGDTPDEPLKTDKTGATVDFTGDSFTNFPSDVATNVDSLIKYYTDRGYLVKTKPSDEELSGKFDGDKTQTQYLKLQLVHDKATVTGNDPKTPGEPINPKDPNGSKYPPEAGKDKLVISSQNIIHYYDEAGNKILDDKVTTDDSTLTRTVTIDKVTGDVISTGKWTGDKEYENVNTPVVNGYYVDKASASAGASTVTPADADPNSRRVHDGVITNETTVIYHPMGHIIPKDKSGNKIPGAETPIFTNDTKDPTKASTTNSPIIPGYHLETPSDSAITPDEPGKDRPVVYVADTQELKVQVFDLDGDTPDEPLKTDKTGATVDFTGDSFTNFPSDVATNVDSLIKYYTDRGYLVKTKPSDEELSGKFDGDKTQTQYLKLQLVHDKATVTGNDPKTPGEPINPKDPNGSKYPPEAGKDKLVISSQNIIHYYDEAGNKILDDKVNTDDSTLTREVTIDKVTSDVISTGNWTGGKEYENVNTPVVNGYYTDRVSAGASTVTPADADPNSGRVHNGVITNETTVIYHPMGHIIPIDKSGKKIPGAETPIFNNDPNDSTKGSTTNSPIIPGYHLETPSDSAITPDEPGKDRPVVYVADTQELKVQVFDLDGDTPDEPLKTDKTGATVDFTGDSFTNFPSDVATNVDSLIKYYTDRGYLVKTKPSDEELSGKFDGDKTQTQYLKLQLVHDKATVSGEDENTPVPDTPINENDPDGVKYPSDVSKDNLVISSKNIIHYYDEAGNKILDDKVNTDDSTLTREVTIDKVTSDVISTGNWTGGKEYENVNTPVVNGYYTDRVSAGASTVTPADADPNSGRVHNGVITNETTVIYHPMGHIIPIDKSGKKIPGAETPIFNNDPNDSTKGSTTNSPIIPGYHLETPSDSAITPDEPGKNRPVVYVADTQELKVQVFDLDGDTPDEPLKTDKTGATVDFTGDSFTNFPSDVATNVDSLIKYYTDRGYLVKTKPSDEELSGKFDGDKTQTQYLKLQLVHDKVTVSGEDENTPAPETPINENDPDSVKYPSDVSKDNLVISSEVIIHYEGAGEKTPKDVIRTVDKTLTRTVTIDKVTGKVTNTSDWSSNTTEYESVLTPQIQEYTSDKVQVDKVSITKDNAGEAKNGKITYTFNVVYTPDKQQLILKVHDEDTQSYLGDTVIFDGYSDQEVGNSSVDKLEELKKKYLDLGYEIVEIPQLDKNYDDTQNVGGEPDKEPQVFVLKVKHRIVPVTPDDPKTPDDIIPDSNQNYPGGLTETDLSRTITRTIVVNFPSGTSQEIKQVVTYTRTATVDAVTKEVKYSAWTTKNSDWPEQVAPTVPGYTPDKDKVDLTYVPADGNDVTVEINYTADPETDEPTTPVTPSKPEKPAKPVKPTEPSEPEKPAKPVKPTEPSKPEKPAKQTKPEVVKPVKETKGKQFYGSAQAKVDSKAARNVVDKNKANGTNDKKLPQTNGESDWQLSLLGVGVLALALLVLKKKRDDE